MATDCMALLEKTGSRSRPWDWATKASLSLISLMSLRCSPVCSLSSARRVSSRTKVTTRQTRPLSSKTGDPEMTTFLPSLSFCI